MWGIYAQCGGTDSQDHRLHQCQDRDVTEVRDEPPPNKAAKMFNQWLSHPDTDELQLRTWLPIRPSHGRPLEEVHVIFQETQGFKFDRGKPIYSDGSCFHPTESNLAIAGAALVQLDEH